jgi:hypothetical protein
MKNTKDMSLLYFVSLFIKSLIWCHKTRFSHVCYEQYGKSRWILFEDITLLLIKRIYKFVY